MPGILKFAGLFLIGLSAFGVGMSAAHALGEQVHELETARAVLDGLAGELSYGLTPLDEAVNRLCRRESLQRAVYLETCAGFCREGKPFPEAWRESICQNRRFSEPDKEALIGLSDILGQASLEEQLTSLAHVKRILDASLEQARGYAESHGKLYRTLGALGGVFLVIFWI